MADADEKQTIVIIGGGIIGCTTAYFLTRHPAYSPARHRIILLEATGIAGGASGKAGGLLARWAYPRCLVPLSFRLHAELAATHGGAERWGYRALRCGEVDIDARKTAAARNGSAAGNGAPLPKRDGKEARKKGSKRGIPEELLDWMDADAVTGYDAMAAPDDTAQVHPGQFTAAMAALAQEGGVEVMTGRAERLNYTTSSTSNGTDKLGNSSSPTLASITYTDVSTSITHTLPARTAVVAAGPWTQSLLPTAPIQATRAHSVVIRPAAPLPAHAVFTSVSLPRGEAASPEIYPRPDGTVYACGAGDTSVPLPGSTAHVVVGEDRVATLERHLKAISPLLAEGEVLARQACYLPTVAGGARGPLVGFVPGVRGVLLAAGHTCWGIQNAPATGKVVSEMVLEGKAASADVRSLDPGQVL